MYGEGAETLVTVSRQPSFGGGVIRLQLVVMKQRFMHVGYMRHMSLTHDACLSKTAGVRLE